MGERKLTITDGDKTYAGLIGTIKTTFLGYEDHGILTASLEVTWNNGGIRVGGYNLDGPRDPERSSAGRIGTAFGLDQIICIIETVGVDSWERLVGKQVIVLFPGGSTHGIAGGIAHAIDENKVLDFRAHAEAWREAEAFSKVEKAVS